ncbi:MAG: competence/damage-inducible protein A [Acidobacteria bacterium]|nr:competence/damage-inducible protein A [Acidobacteriota bacterium]
MRAAIIAIGSELLTPHRTDTNSLWLTERLNDLGIHVALKVAVPDDRESLCSTLKSLLSRFPLIISTGGLGPTEDDLTRESFAEALGLSLRFVPEIHEIITRRFEARQLPMSVNNRKQAMVLEGARWLRNSAGTAPGMYLDRSGITLVMLPGPPHEMRGIFIESVEPVLRSRSGGSRIYRRLLRATGLPESALDDQIAPIYAAYPEIETTILASVTGHEIHLATVAAESETADERLGELSRRIADRLGSNLFTTSGERLEAVLMGMLVQRGATVSAAESCTGGLVSKRLTDLAGSSTYFRGGVVAYDNAAKARLLGVPGALIAERGAVSSEVAEQMARGVRAKFESTFGMGITGIAGPGGGTEDKPVGLVYVSVADERDAVTRRLSLPGDRQHVRAWSAQIALDMLRRRLLSAS